MKSEEVRGNNKVICVTGPTASGKSELAVKLCRRFGGELLSFDSMQIYRRLDIGTAKPTAAERAEVPHHLIDICEPDENYSVADFVSSARACVNDVISRNKIPVLCGGTGLYFDSFMNGIDFGEAAPDTEYREELRNILSLRGAEFLHGMLREADPEAAGEIHPNNVKRVIRALEIIKSSGMTKTQWDKVSLKNNSPYEYIGITLDFENRAVLHERINSRVEKMMSLGLASEVEALLKDGYLVDGTTASGAIGYKELISYFKGNCSLSDAVESIKTATRQYAKRQLTWFRRGNKYAVYYPDSCQTDSDALYESVAAYVASKTDNK